MTAIELQAIEFHSKQFREALEKCPKNLLPIGFRDFPRGSCGDASLLLAKYLQNMKCGMFDFVCGEISENDEHGFQTHAWLQRNDLIIDITADQFEEIESSVIITRNRSWYERFEIEITHIADYDIYDGFTRASLAVAYHQVVRFIT